MDCGKSPFSRHLDRTTCKQPVCMGEETGVGQVGTGGVGRKKGSRDRGSGDGTATESDIRFVGEGALRS